MAPPSKFSTISQIDPDNSFVSHAAFRDISVLIGRYLGIGVSAHTLKRHISAHLDRVRKLAQTDITTGGLAFDELTYDAESDSFIVPRYRGAEIVSFYRYCLSCGPDKARMIVPIGDGSDVYIKIEPGRFAKGDGRERRPHPNGSIKAVFEYLCKQNAPLSAADISAGLCRSYDTIKYDLRALYRHLNLIERAVGPGSGRNAIYIVPKSVKARARGLSPILDPFEGSDLRPTPALLNLVREVFIDSALTPPDHGKDNSAQFGRIEKYFDAYYVEMLRFLRSHEREGGWMRKPRVFAARVASYQRMTERISRHLSQNLRRYYAVESPYAGRYADFIEMVTNLNNDLAAISFKADRFLQNGEFDAIFSPLREKEEELNMAGYRRNIDYVNIASLFEAVADRLETNVLIRIEDRIRSSIKSGDTDHMKWLVALLSDTIDSIRALIPEIDIEPVLEQQFAIARRAEELLMQLKARIYSSDMSALIETLSINHSISMPSYEARQASSAPRPSAKSLPAGELRDFMSLIEESTPELRPVKDAAGERALEFTVPQLALMMGLKTLTSAKLDILTRRANLEWERIGSARRVWTDEATAITRVHYVNRAKPEAADISAPTGIPPERPAPETLPLWRSASTKVRDLREQSVSIDEKTEIALRYFDLGSLYSHQELPGGIATRKPLLLRTSKGDFVLKYAADSLGRAETVISLLIHMRHRGIPVPIVYPKKGFLHGEGGRYLVKIGSWYYYVEGYIKGVEKARDRLEPRDFVSIGRMLAGIHRESKGFMGKGVKRELRFIDILSADADFRALRDSMPREEELTRGQRLFLQYYPLISSQLEKMRTVLQESSYENLPKTWVHHDAGTQNIEWSPDGSILSLLDWERARFQARIEDFKNALLAAGAAMGRKYDRASLLALVKGYQLEAGEKLTPLELDAIPLLIGIGTFGWDLAKSFILKPDDTNGRDYQFVSEKYCAEFERLVRDLEGSWWDREKDKLLGADIRQMLCGCDRIEKISESLASRDLVDAELLLMHVFSRSTYDDPSVSPRVSDGERLALLAKALAISLRRADSDDIASYLVSILKDKADSLMPEAVMLIRSYLYIYNLDRPVKVGIAFALFRGQRKISDIPEDDPGYNPISQNFLRRKIAQLDDLFGVSPMASYRLALVQDGDDTSNDPELRSTADVADNILLEYKERLADGRIKVLRLPQTMKARMGSQKHGALACGMKYLLDSGCDMIGYTDGDLSTHMGQVGLLIGALNEGQEAAFGSIRLRDSVVRNRLPRRILSTAVFGYFVRLCIGPLSGVKDTQRSFKLFRREVIRNITPVRHMHLSPDGVIAKMSYDPDFVYNFTGDVEWLSRARLLGYRMKEVPIAWVDDPFGTTVGLFDYFPMIEAVSRVTATLDSFRAGLSSGRGPYLETISIDDEAVAYPPGTSYMRTALSTTVRKYIARNLRSGKDVYFAIAASVFIYAIVGVTRRIASRIRHGSYIKHPVSYDKPDAANLSSPAYHAAAEKVRGAAMSLAAPPYEMTPPAEPAAADISEPLEIGPDAGLTADAPEADACRLSLQKPMEWLGRVFAIAGPDEIRSMGQFDFAFKIGSREAMYGESPIHYVGKGMAQSLRNGIGAIMGRYRTPYGLARKVIADARDVKGPGIYFNRVSLAAEASVDPKYRTKHLFAHEYFEQCAEESGMVTEDVARILGHHSLEVVWATLEFASILGGDERALAMQWLEEMITYADSRSRSFAEGAAITEALKSMRIVFEYPKPQSSDISSPRQDGRRPIKTSNASDEGSVIGSEISGRPDNRYPGRQDLGRAAAIPAELNTADGGLAVVRRDNIGTGSLKICGIQVGDGPFSGNTAKMVDILRGMSAWGDWKPALTIFPETMDDIRSAGVDPEARMATVQREVDRSGIAAGYFIESGSDPKSAGDYQRTYTILRPNTPPLVFRKFNEHNEERLFDIGGRKAALLICFEALSAASGYADARTMDELRKADVILLPAGTDQSAGSAWPSKLARLYGKPVIFVNFGGGSSLSRPVSTFVFAGGDSVGNSLTLGDQDAILYADVDGYVPAPHFEIDEYQRAKWFENEQYADGSESAAPTGSAENIKPEAADLADPKKNGHGDRSPTTDQTDDLEEVWDVTEYRHSGKLKCDLKLVEGDRTVGRISLWIEPTCIVLNSCDDFNVSGGDRRRGYGTTLFRRGFARAVSEAAHAGMHPKLAYVFYYGARPSAPRVSGMAQFVRRFAFRDIDKNAIDGNPAARNIMLKYMPDNESGMYGGWFAKLDGMDDAGPVSGDAFPQREAIQTRPDTGTAAARTLKNAPASIMDHGMAKPQAADLAYSGISHRLIMTAEYIFGIFAFLLNPVLLNGASQTIMKYEDVWICWDRPTVNEDGSALDDLAGFKLYVNGIAYDIGATNTVKAPIEATPVKRKIVFKATAYNTAGTESRFSEPVVVNLPPTNFEAYRASKSQIGFFWDDDMPVDLRIIDSSGSETIVRLDSPAALWEPPVMDEDYTVIVNEPQSGEVYCQDVILLNPSRLSASTQTKFTAVEAKAAEIRFAVDIVNLEKGAVSVNLSFDGRRSLKDRWEPEESVPNILPLETNSISVVIPVTNMPPQRFYRLRLSPGSVPVPTPISSSGNIAPRTASAITASKPEAANMAVPSEIRPEPGRGAGMAAGKDSPGGSFLNGVFQETATGTDTRPAVQARIEGTSGALTLEEQIEILSGKKRPYKEGHWNYAHPYRYFLENVSGGIGNLIVAAALTRFSAQLYSCSYTFSAVLSIYSVLNAVDAAFAFSVTLQNNMHRIPLFGKFAKIFTKSPVFIKIFFVLQAPIWVPHEIGHALAAIFLGGKLSRFTPMGILVTHKTANASKGPFYLLPDSVNARYALEIIRAKRSIAPRKINRDGALFEPETRTTTPDMTKPEAADLAAEKHAPQERVSESIAVEPLAAQRNVPMLFSELVSSEESSREESKLFTSVANLIREAQKEVGFWRWWKERHWSGALRDAMVVFDNGRAIAAWAFIYPAGSAGPERSLFGNIIPSYVDVQDDGLFVTADHRGNGLAQKLTIELLRYFSKRQKRIFRVGWQNSPILRRAQHFHKKIWFDEKGEKRYGVLDFAKKGEDLIWVELDVDKYLEGYDARARSAVSAKKEETSESGNLSQEGAQSRGAPPSDASPQSDGKFGAESVPRARQGPDPAQIAADKAGELSGGIRRRTGEARSTIQKPLHVITTLSPDVRTGIEALAISARNGPKETAQEQSAPQIGVTEPVTPEQLAPHKSAPEGSVPENASYDNAWILKEYDDEAYRQALRDLEKRITRSSVTDEERYIDAVINAISAGRSKARTERQVFVAAIDGNSGAIKTTTAKRIADEIRRSGGKAIVIERDWYIKSRDSRYREQDDELAGKEYSLKDDEISLRTDKFEADILRKIARFKARRDETLTLDLTELYNKNDMGRLTRPAESIVIDRDTVVLIEGNYLLKRRWSGYFDLKALMLARPSIGMERRKDRDESTGSRPQERVFWRINTPSFIEYMRHDMDTPDLVAITDSWKQPEYVKNNRHKDSALFEPETRTTTPVMPKPEASDMAAGIPDRPVLFEDLMSAYFAGRSSLRGLDLGAGLGDKTRWVSDMMLRRFPGTRFEGVERTPQLLRIAAKRGNPVNAMDVTKLIAKYGPRSQDLITIFWPYPSDLSQFVDTAKALIKDDGVIIVSLQDDDLTELRENGTLFGGVEAGTIRGALDGFRFIEVRDETSGSDTRVFGRSPHVFLHSPRAAQRASTFLNKTVAEPYIERVAADHIERRVASILPRGARILDLMSGAFTYVPDSSGAAEIVGVGLNGKEMGLNARLTGRMTQDLNDNPALPPDFEGRFDSVIITSGMAYIKDRGRFFRSAAKALKPGGTLFIAYNPLYYNEEAVPDWRDTMEDYKAELVIDALRSSGQFTDVVHERKSYIGRFDTAQNLDIITAVRSFSAHVSAGAPAKAKPKAADMAAERDAARSSAVEEPQYFMPQDRIMPRELYNVGFRMLRDDIFIIDAKTGKKITVFSLRRPEPGRTDEGMLALCTADMVIGSFKYSQIDDGGLFDTMYISDLNVDETFRHGYKNERVGRMAGARLMQAAAEIAILHSQSDLAFILDSDNEPEVQNFYGQFERFGLFRKPIGKDKIKWSLYKADARQFISGIELWITEEGIRTAALSKYTVSEQAAPMTETDSRDGSAVYTMHSPAPIPHRLQATQISAYIGGAAIRSPRGPSQDRGAVSGETAAFLAPAGSVSTYHDSAYYWLKELVRADAIDSNTALIIFDAHFDIRRDYVSMNEKNWLRKAREEFLEGPVYMVLNKKRGEYHGDFIEYVEQAARELKITLIYGIDEFERRIFTEKRMAVSFEADFIENDSPYGNDHNKRLARDNIDSRTGRIAEAISAKDCSVAAVHYCSARGYVPDGEYITLSMINALAHLNTASKPIPGLSTSRPKELVSAGGSLRIIKPEAADLAAEKNEPHERVSESIAAEQLAPQTSVPAGNVPETAETDRERTVTETGETGFAKPSKFTTVFFDIGSVLLRPISGRIVDMLSRYCNRSKDEISAAIIGVGDPDKLLFEKGLITNEEFFSRTRAKLGLAMDYETFVRIYNIDREVITENVAILKKLKTAGYQIGIISDINALSRDYFLSRHNDISALVDVFIASCDVGMMKDDPRMFEIALKASGGDPRRAVFIDDLASNIAVAQSKGITTVQFIDKETDLFASLKSMLDAKSASAGQKTPLPDTSALVKPGAAEKDAPQERVSESVAAEPLAPQVSVPKGNVPENPNGNVPDVLAGFISENCPAAQMLPMTSGERSYITNQYLMTTEDSTRTLSDVRRLYDKYIELIGKINSRVKERLGVSDVRFSRIMFEVDTILDGSNPMRCATMENPNEFGLVINLAYMLQHKQSELGLEAVAHEMGHGMIGLTEHDHNVGNLTGDREAIADWVASSLLSKDEMKALFKQKIEACRHADGSHIPDFASYALALLREIKIEDDFVRELDIYAMRDRMDLYSRFYRSIRWNDKILTKIRSQENTTLAAEQAAPQGSVSESIAVESLATQGSVPKGNVPELSEKINAIRLADTIKLIQAADTKQPVILALGTSWIKGYKRGEPQYNDLNRLISAIRNYCDARGVTFINTDDDSLLSEIEKRRTKSPNAKVIVVAGKESIAPEGAVLAPLRDDSNAFLAAVDSSELDSTCYVRLAEMLRIALELGLKDLFRDTADLANPNISISTLAGFRNVVIFLPRAERIPVYENLRKLYRVQEFA